MSVKHRIRMENGGHKEVTIARGTAIKIFCTECMGYISAEVARCTDKNCPLYPFRGVNLVAVGKAGND